VQGSELASLGAVTSRSQTALLCLEADANYCHRSMVAAAVARLRQTPVLHITSCAVASERASGSPNNRR